MNILKVKEILRDKGMTINDLANVMGINRVTLSNIINGNPTLETLQKIANSLGVKITELFMEVNENRYSISKNEFGNHYSYNDENVFLNSFLPHLIKNEVGSFSLDIKRKEFSIVPNRSEIYELVSSEESIEEIVFKGNSKGQVLVKLFSSFTSLTLAEYSSFCEALRMFIYFHKQCEDELASLLGASNFKKENYNSDYYLLGKVNRIIWNKLIALTKIYDLDSDKDELGKYNYTGRDIMMYNLEIERNYNIKMWISPIDHLSTDKEVMIGWKIPRDFNRKLIVENLIFNAQESYDFLYRTMIPKAIDL